MIKESLIKKNIEKKMVSPSVGQYDPDYCNSIEYKNYKKINSNIKRPAFNYGQVRFKNNKYETIKAGPGSYDLIKKEIKSNQRLFPFMNGNDDRINVRTVNNPNVGPGSYNNILSWNRKSYNTKYI